MAAMYLTAMKMVWRSALDVSSVQVYALRTVSMYEDLTIQPPKPKRTKSHARLRCVRCGKKPSKFDINSGELVLNAEKRWEYIVGEVSPGQRKPSLITTVVEKSRGHHLAFEYSVSRVSVAPVESSKQLMGASKKAILRIGA